MPKRFAEWFRDCATYTAWPQMPRAHGPFGKDRLTRAERTFMAGIPLFVNVQTRSAIREAHELGGRALSYLSFMDTYVHTEGFENGTARVAWDPGTPQMLLLDRDGRFRNTQMDSTWRMWRYLVCSNTREYVEAALEMVHRQMKMGADGLFIDNSGRREPCYGHGLPVGFSDHYRQVMAAIPTWDDSGMRGDKTPEELHRRGVAPGYRKGNARIEALPRHRHIYPDRSHDYAYTRLLEKVRKAVRSYGRDKVVLVNGHATTEHADGLMLESYIYSWAWKGPRQDWQSLKRDARELRRRLGDRTRVLALSYLGTTGRAVAEDALFACGAASLFGYLWSDYGTFKGPLGDRLRRLDLGRRITKPRATGDLDHAFFERGLVAVNGGTRRRAATLPAPPGFAAPALVNLIDGGEVLRRQDAFRVVVPAAGGRILLQG
jgi:hypothetical protein